jgi:hypothetical protein
MGHATAMQHGQVHYNVPLYALASYVVYAICWCTPNMCSRWGAPTCLAGLLLQALDFPLLIQDQGHMLQHLLGVSHGRVHLWHEPHSVPGRGPCTACMPRSRAVDQGLALSRQQTAVSLVPHSAVVMQTCRTPGSMGRNLAMLL